ALTRSLPIPLPGLGTYILPRLPGPNTAYTHANPCYSTAGKSKHSGFAEDLSNMPGPATFPRVELDLYKTRSPTYTMGTRARPGGDPMVKPGLADYCLAKVRQPAHLSSSALPQPALKQLRLPMGLPRTPGNLTTDQPQDSRPAPLPWPTARQREPKEH
ncbi:ODF3A protein, partial [Chroicocephalus maculipennis]|nr:ODF3A protein [Chroicocephalus maculipennis]